MKKKEVSLTGIGKKYSFDITMSRKHDMLCELSLIVSPDAGGAGFTYIKEIVSNLDLVLSGKLKMYEFGFDATIIEFGKEKTIINYNYFEDELEVSSENIYNLMRDWYEELQKTL